MWRAVVNLWKTLLHPDKEELENPERRVILDAANILQIGEFQLLQLAYLDWFDEDLPEDQTDVLFNSYMIDGAVPPWARHYARNILREEQSGLLDYNQRRYHLYDCDYNVKTRLNAANIAFALGFAVMMVGGGIAISNFEADASISMFPPYISDTDLQPQAKI